MASGNNRRRERRRLLRALIIVLVLAAIVIASVTVIVIYLRDYLASKLPEKTWRRAPPYRVDCHPEGPADPGKCLQRGCSWMATDMSGEPLCVFSEGHGYRIDGKPTTDASGQRYTLKRVANGTLFGNDAQTIDLHVRYISRYVVQLKFSDPSEPRFEVPEDPPLRPDSDLFNKTYEVAWENDPQFGIVVRRPISPDWRLSSGQQHAYDASIVFDSRNPGLVFSSQFLQIPVRLPSSNVFGLGSTGRQQLRQDLNWRRTTLWARPFDKNRLREEPAFGSQSFLMCLENDGKASGIFLRNSNAMEVTLQPEPAVVFRTVGGVLDFYVFLGPTPEAVVQQYTKVVGRPMLPPYWSLGFHFGRQKTGNSSNLAGMVQQMKAAKIPFDSVHLGDDVLSENVSYSFNDISYWGLNTMFTDLHQQGRRAFISSWAGVATNFPGPYPALTEGETRKLFVRRGLENCQGQLFGKRTFYPDYSHTGARDYWATLVVQYRRTFSFEALYLMLDKNAPESEIDGCGGTCPQNNWNKPPYVPPDLEGSLYKHTLCPDVQHVSGLHYNVHNLYALHQARAASTGWIHAYAHERPLLLSRSHAPGIGRYAGHFISDTDSTWADLQRSVVDIMQFNLVGIPLVGSDICGFYGNASDELCMRWTQAGAFYPFSHNYNHGDNKDQHPSSLGSEALRKSKEALRARYQLLPYLYTLFYLASQSGGTVVRPLFHEFPRDNLTYDVNDQFLWGPGLLICPVLSAANQQGAVYLPQNRWYYFPQGNEVVYAWGQTSLPRTDLILLVRGGHVIPVHTLINDTTHNRDPLRLLVALDEEETAEGSFYADDKESPVANQLVSRGTLLKFQLKQNQFVIRSLSSGYNDGGNLIIQEIAFWGVKKKPDEVHVNNIRYNSFFYDSFNKVLLISNLRFRIIDTWNQIDLKSKNKPFPNYGF